MDEKQRKEIIDDMAPVANRRLERLSNLEIPSPAFNSRQVWSKDGKEKLRDYTGQWLYDEFSSKGKDKARLGNEIQYMQMFFKNKTSTVKGANYNTKKMMARVLNTNMNKVDLSKISYEQTKAFWEGYTKALESNIGILDVNGHHIADRLGSTQIQQSLYNTYEESEFKMDSDELYEAAQKYIDDDYATRKR